MLPRLRFVAREQVSLGALELKSHVSSALSSKPPEYPPRSAVNYTPHASDASYNSTSRHFQFAAAGATYFLPAGYVGGLPPNISPPTGK